MIAINIIVNVVAYYTSKLKHRCSGGKGPGYGINYILTLIIPLLVSWCIFYVFLPCLSFELILRKMENLVYIYVC